MCAVCARAPAITWAKCNLKPFLMEMLLPQFNAEIPQYIWSYAWRIMTVLRWELFLSRLRCDTKLLKSPENDMQKNPSEWLPLDRFDIVWPENRCWLFRKMLKPKFIYLKSILIRPYSPSAAYWCWLKTVNVRKLDNKNRSNLCDLNTRFPNKLHSDTVKWLN